MYVIAGDAGMSENRWFGITPLEQWATSYYAPVATVDALSAPAHIFLHNANATAITVFYDTKSSTGNSIAVAANSTNAIQMPASAAHFYTTNGAKFYAVGTIDSGNSSTTQDWSYSLVPESYLTDKFVVAWGPGSSSTPPSSALLNGSPVWVTSAANTWLYVDSATVEVKRSDGTLVTGEAVDADTTRFAVATLESYRLSDTSDKDQTGLVVYTTDGTLITAAWGEDPSVAGAGTPYLDMGTTVLPYPDYVFRKVSTEASPVTFGNGTSDGDTLVELNEQIEYSITIANRAVIDLFNVNIKDALTPSDSATYVAGSANLTVLDADGNVLLYNADLDGASNSFPLAGAGYSLADSDPNTAGVQGLQRGHQIVVKYRVQVRSDINQAMADDNYVISNTATLAGSPPVGDPIDPKSTTRETKVSAIDARPQSVVESSSLAGSTFTISNLVGLTKITVGTTDVTLAQLTASGTTPVAVTTAEGSLTIGGYNATTGVVTYAYDPAGLSKNHSGGAVTDNVALSATYSNSAVVVTTLAISVTDTSPTANADTKRITENATSVSDNVISGATAADTILADATTVSGIVAGHVVGPVSGNVGSSVAGAYGSIVLGSNGAYNYALDNANPAVQNLDDGGSITDVFTYTLTDADGDSSTTQISITIDGMSDTPPSISVNDVTVNEAAGTLTFTVLRTGTTNLASSVNYAMVDGTASAGTDYTATSGTLSFLAGETSKTVSVAITNDNVFELSEAFSLSLTAGSNAVIADGMGIGTIRDDGTGSGGTNDDRPSFSVNDVTVNEAAGTLTFTVTKSGATALASTVDFATVDGTAVAGADYAAASGTLSFLAGETSKTVSIAITNDNLFELSEAFDLNLTNANNAVVGDGLGVGTIKDDGTGPGGTDDDRPSFSVNDVTVNEAAGTLTFTVTKSGATALASTVDFATADGNAVAGADYTATSGTLSFLAGETSKTVSIAINNDNVFELSEAFNLNLSNAANAVVADGQGVGTIKDDGTGPGGSDDDRPSFSVNDVTVNEAAGTLTFTVTKAGATALASTVDFAAVDGTAVAGADYIATSGTLTILAGETSKAVSIAITNDTVFELSEAFNLSLTNANNAVIANGLGVGTIRDDGTGFGGTNDDRPSFSVNDVTVNEAAGTLTFTVTKAGATALTSTVDFATADGTAVAGADYTATSGTLSFLAGETSKTVSVAITNDTVFELSEAFNLSLTNASNAVIADGLGVGTIRDDGTGFGGTNDDRPSFSVDDVTVNEAAGTLSFTVTKTGATTLASTVDFATTDGTAIAGADYTATSGTLSFLAGEISKTVSVAISNDNLFEQSEAFNLNLTNAINAVIADSTGVGTIRDDGTGPGGTDDDRPSFSVNDATVNEAAGTLSFTVTKTGATTLASTVDFATTDGTATAGADYTATSGTLSFFAGETSKAVSIAITNDNVFELSEAFNLSLINASNAVIADGLGVGTIRDDGTGIGGTNDDRPSFSVNDVTVNEAAGTLTFTVTKSGATALASNVDYFTADGTATAGADYTATSGTLSFLAGEASKTVSIAVRNDNIFELSEAFNLNLSNATNAVIADGAGVGTIKDDGTGPGGSDDDRPSFSVNDVTVNEAAGTLTFTVTKAGATALASSVDFATVDGTAVAGADYTTTSGTLSFLAGETTKTVSVAITNDNIFELSEAFSLNLTNAGNAAIADETGIGTIKDDGTGPGGTDDDRPSFSVNDVTVNEAARTLTFTVTQAGATALASTVDYSTADGTAVAGADYTTTSGTLSFLAGETSKTVSIAIANDNLFELSEAFDLNLTNAINAVIANGLGVGTIRDDGTGFGGTNDDRPSFSVNDVTVNEAAGTLTFTVTKSGATALTSTVDFATADGTAVAGADYAAGSGTLSFLAGETSKTVSIAIANDNLFELSEAFDLNLTNAINAVIANGLGVGTIRDDGTGFGGTNDDRPSFSVNDVTVNEAAGTLTFTVTKAGATALTSTVDFATADGTAVAGADYAAASGTLSFLAGETSKTVSVAISNDNLFEQSEAFNLNLTNAINAVIADSTGVGTIRDDGTGPGGTDDDRPSFSVNDVTVNEAAGTLSFTVTKTGATTLASPVDFATTDGTATAGADYTATSGTLSFFAGETSKAVSIAITNDNVFELSEAFNLSLINARNAVIADGLGVGTIRDDGTGFGGTNDDRPSFSVNDVTVNEAAGTLTFTVTKAGATALASTVDYSTADGTAVAGADYTTTSGTLSFLAGETSKTVSIAITNDNLFELSEAFDLNLTNAINAVIADSTGVGTIRDDGTGLGGTDDDRPSFSVNDVTVNEAAGTLTFTVTKSGATALASTADFATADGNAVAGTDYTATSGTLSFLAGETSKTVSIAINNDNVFELSEAFNLNLSNAANAVVADGQGVGTIKDDGTGPGGSDDDRPSFSVNDATVNEAAGTLSFTVTKTGATTLASTVDFATTDGTAIAGADYTATSGTLSFLAGETSKTVSVAISNDNLFEQSEAFNLNLTNAINAVIADGTGVGTIKDDGTGPGGSDNDRPSFSVNDVTINETAGWLTFTVTKSGATALASTVDYSTADGTAVEGADYIATSGTLSFLAAETSKTVSIAITNDNVFELSEAFNLNLTNANNAVIAGGLGVGTIKDDGTGLGGTDDDRPSFSVDDVTVNEAAGTLTFTVTKNGSTALASTVDYSTADGTAVAGADYIATSGTLSFLAGERSKTINVAITNDNVFEWSEAFDLDLSNAGNAVIADGIGVATIQDDGTGSGGSDDDRPSFSVNDVTVNEAAGTLTFTVTKSGATTLVSTVDFATTDGTATAGADYTAIGGTLSFQPGETSKAVTVAITNDSVFELSEAFTLQLSNARNAVIAEGTGAGTIKDDGTGPGGTDDDRPSFSVGDVTVNEAAGTLNFTVTKTGSTVLASSVDVATVDGTAVVGADYTGATGSLNFLADETSKTVIIAINDDNIFELSEVFGLNLGNAANATIGDGTGFATIRDDGTGGTDDDRPSFSIDDVTVNEAAGTLTFTITKTGATALTSTVDYTTSDGTAVAGADYEAARGTLSFLAAESSRTVSVRITNDDLFELSEAFSLNLPNAGQAHIGIKAGLATIKDDGTGHGGLDDDRVPPVVQAPPAPVEPTAPRQPVTEPAGRIETLSEFPILVADVDLPDSRHDLTLERDIPDQPLPANGAQMSFTIPTDTFVHTDTTAQVSLAATMVDGTALPTWLKFDHATGSFSGTPPRGLQGELQVKVLARDDMGRQAETIVRIASEVPVPRAAEAVYGASETRPTTPSPSTAAVDRPVPAMTTPAADQRLPDAQPSPATITTISGFQVLVDKGARSASDHELRLNQSIPDQVFPRGLLLVRYQVPVDAFIHTDSAARVELSAAMIDGSELPPWLQFKAEKGEFKGMPPLGFRGDLLIKVIARDGAGRQAETIVRISIGEPADNLAVGGKPALTAQMRPFGITGWKAERDRLVAQAHEATVKAKAAKAA